MSSLPASTSQSRPVNGRFSSVHKWPVLGVARGADLRSASVCVRALLDASAFRHVCETKERTAGHQLRNWITRGDGVVVYSNSPAYAVELDKSPAVKALLADFSQRGRTIRIDPELVQTEEQYIPPRPPRRSDDPHVLALAMAGEATVLFSCDTALRNDFCELLSRVGRQTRSSFPLKVDQPQDITAAGKRRQFLERRKCPSRH